MDITKLSKKYKVKILKEEDIEDIYIMCSKNEMFYKYCPPFVSLESIAKDMKALPPKKRMEDKYYIGFYDNKNLLAVMDLILKYPNEETSFIGFFMMNKDYQGRGIGTTIVEECFAHLSTLGYKYIRLGFAKGNKQSECFWKKNKFESYNNLEVPTDDYIIVILQRDI